MSRPCWGAAVAALLIANGQSVANLIVSYTDDAGGSNPGSPGGLSAEATFELSGTSLTITLRNTSTGAPLGAEVSDSLLVSLAMTLPDGAVISDGVGAVIGPGSVGLGSWGGEDAGFDVGDQWLWTNDAGGDLLESFAQVISTSQGQGGGSTESFNGVPNPNVGGPFGGIAAAPPILSVPGSQEAVSDSIVFTLALSAVLTPDELRDVAGGSIVEFGSDYQYLRPIPGPGTVALLLLGAWHTRPARRRASS